MTPRWQRRNTRARHGDDWLMTYADMITLLLCFFAMFLAVSMPKKNMPPKVDPPPILAQVQPVIPPLAPPVKQPEILEGNLPFHAIPELDAPADAEPEVVADAPPAPVAATVPPAASLPDIVNTLKPQDAANLDQTSDRLTTLQISSATFFSSGSAVLNASGKPILQAVAANLKSDKFKDYIITVEGHTDDQPISTAQFPSNWELSTARAAAVVHFFLDQGIPAQRLRAAGYADTFPLAPNRDAKGAPLPDNQASNRRVVIKLERVQKAG